MQLPRLAVLLAVYSGVHATLMPDEPTGKPEMKLESNQTGAARFFNMPQFAPMNTGLGSFKTQLPLQPFQPQQVLNQPQPQFRQPIQTWQYTPYPGSGTVEQQMPLQDDLVNNKFSFSGGSANSGFSSGSLGGLGGLSGMTLPQTLTVYGSIPVTVSGTLNFGVRGQLSVAQDGPLDGPLTAGTYESQPLILGSSSFGAPQQVFGLPLSYQPGLSTSYVQGMSRPLSSTGSITSSGSSYSKLQSEEMGQTQMQGQTQVIYGATGSRQNMMPSFQGGQVNTFVPLTQTGFEFPKQGSMNSMSSQAMPMGPQLAPMPFQVQRQAGPNSAQIQYNSPRYSEVVGRALNDEPAAKMEK